MSQTLTHSDTAHDSTDDVSKKPKSRKPANTAFRQQRLKAWQPILTPKTVLPIFFGLGIIFAPIGGGLLYASSTVQELAIDYTNCRTQATSDFTQIPTDNVHSAFKSSAVVAKPQWRHTTGTRQPRIGAEVPNTDICTLQFTLPNEIGAPVYLYYRLTNFYQNHRRYVKSLDTNQLGGSFVSNNSMKSSSCSPLTTNDAGIAIYPCGLIANSIFNDTIHSPTAVSTSEGQTASNYSMTNQGIAWSSDLTLYKQTVYKYDQVVPPPNWIARFPGGVYTANGSTTIPDLSTYEEFAVWMRTAGLPTFSKLALRNDNKPMPAGTYQLEIDDYFPVSEYGGTKSLLISTSTIIGGKNDFLGIAYIVVGGLCIILGVLFTIAHVIRPRKLGDHTYLSWNTDSTTTASTT